MSLCYQMEQDSALVDIEKILQDKAPKYARYVPGFLVSYLKRIVHQDELNSFLSANRHLEGVDIIREFLNYMDINIIVKGEENLPKEGSCTFVSNHPLGGLDGLTLGMVIGEHYQGKVKYLVNDLLMNIKPLAPLFVGINKTGKQAKDFPQRVEASFAAPEQLIMFPAGICSRRQDGIIRDLEWKKTFVSKSVEYQRDIVPIHFQGRNSDFFYNLASWCKKLGIKFNIAMLYLADEMFKNKHKTFTVTIGKPIPWQQFDKSKTPAKWAQTVKDMVYDMGGE